MGDLAPTKIPPSERDCPTVRSESLKKSQKADKADDVVSTITGDSLITFRKKFHFPNDMVMKVPTKSDHAHSPPPGFVTVYEFNLRAGLRFPPSPELIDILTICGGHVHHNGTGRTFQRSWSGAIQNVFLGWDISLVIRRVISLSDPSGWIFVLETRQKVGLATSFLCKMTGIFKKNEKTRNYIYDMEVKALEADYMEEGFIRDFMKGVRAVKRKTGAEIEGLTPSQASSDPSSDSGGEELESELQKAFSLEEEDDIEIL
ncbi:hypothetical protein IEQ34_009256 [Dendrobium chrysotoxum]|uniref:Uncharacterized protein n=1 Tax=Dendrobium chrysotoxum TaxID=161865 RepID=A0AAV7GY67_DENCH|nr:hypothetical protein IEQ34_009256 [Dendrobium chrysotoxum]